MPSGLGNRVQNPEQLGAYARRFLQDAADQGIQVVGITPHSARLGLDEQSSAVWQIVEEWQSGCDNSGTPFRERIYAVFPGFEPSLKDGRNGLHLIFLFDVEIGLENYLKAFNLVMGGVSPWSVDREGELQISNLSASEAFDHLRGFHKRESRTDQSGRTQWDYIVLAPHIDGEKGLLESQKAQVLELFRHDEITGLELGDYKLPDETLDNRPWLSEGMHENRQSFFHSSDAYTTSEIGTRHTWIKVASCRIEALRQAFLAGDSRIRIGYERNSRSELVEVESSPDVTVTARPWLRSVQVQGEASFFGSDGGEVFQFSPDLTCIIGGSMTGKSTLLDGLRIHTGGTLPEDEKVQTHVAERGKERFLAGSPEVLLDCPGRDTTAPLHEQWPAVFYGQTELQRLTESADAVEDILARLVSSETASIVERDSQLGAMDSSLRRLSKRIETARDEFAESEQALARCQAAASELEGFTNAGVGELNEASSNRHRWQELTEDSKRVAKELEEVRKTLSGMHLPLTRDNLAEDGEHDRLANLLRELHEHRNDSDKSLLYASRSLTAMMSRIIEISKAATAEESSLQESFDRSLADLGLDGARINQLQALSEQAALLENSAANRSQANEKLQSLECRFRSSLVARQAVIAQQRDSFDFVFSTIRGQFDGRIIARRIDEDRKDPLDEFLRDLSQRGITRWWNDLSEERRPTPGKLIESLDKGDLSEVGMSPAVEETFFEQMTPARRLALSSLRCRDRYVLEFRVEGENYRDLSKLSGGQRVSLLLSLLLETNDHRPLVIDQPEDELDNRFLFDTMLPALKGLKGKRQIILATHKADIVVNGDADQVIQLDATSDQGRIVCSGAIEDPSVRDAIVQTVDGGDEAFQLRRMKYGF